MAPEILFEYMMGGRWEVAGHTKTLVEMWQEESVGGEGDSYAEAERLNYKVWPDFDMLRT